LVAGAGPFGLAISAYLLDKQKQHLVIGYSMDYWKNHMPPGMFLRSACDWHLDPVDQHTIYKYLELNNLSPADVEPLSLSFYLGYIEWFIKQKGINPHPAWIKKLDSADGHFLAQLDDGQTVQAEKVICAVGLRYFKNIPEQYSTLLPAERFHHTAELVDFSLLQNKKVLIIGGRQSAFEWAALIHEKGAKEIHLTYRHDTPAFTESDWSWVNPMVDAMVDNPSWYRDQTQAEKDAQAQRLWAEGRLKLEPWLAKRITKDSIFLHPHTHVTACREVSSGDMLITLNDETTLFVDHVILATGYKMDITKIPFITRGNIQEKLDTRNGFPALDTSFQSNIPNLYFTGLPAAQDFGPSFGFTSTVRTSAKIIGRSLVK
jgi:cation diffusion facilitator CzcD-associated flavoprotein CzcO